LRYIVVAAALAVAACSRGETARGAAADSAAAPVGMTIGRPYVVPGAGSAPGVAYVDIRGGSVADTLRALSIGGADAMLHDASMQMVSEVAVGPRTLVRLAPGGMHAMYTAAGRALARGDTVTMVLTFAHQGTLRVVARVIEYADVDTATAPRPED
jgi:copper(I)-binding protein